MFVRGLPPSLTEDEFRKTFAAKGTITDVKLFPARRFGYCGYKSADEASQAVKYFNKSFMRMSRINVEIARPIAASTSQSAPIQSVAEPILKRKRGQTPPIAKTNPDESERLKEYLDVMAAPSQPKSWADGQLIQQEQITVPAVVQDDSDKVAVPKDVNEESDQAYQVMKKQKKKNRVEVPPLPPQRQSDEPAQAGQTVELFESGTDQNATSVNVVPESFKDSADAGPLSDSDWLRTRTSRLLGLVEDDGMDPTPFVPQLDKPVSDEDSSGPEEDHGPETPPAVAAPASIGAVSGTIAQAEVEIEEKETTHVEQLVQHGRLFLRNLSYSTTEDDLNEAFQSFGTMKEVSCLCVYPAFRFMMNILIGTSYALQLMRPGRVF